MTLEKLYDKMKDYYCIVENQGQVEELHRLCKEVCPDIIKGNIDIISRFYYFLLVKDPTVRTFTSDSNTYFDAVSSKTANSKLSYPEMVTKIKSLNMKTKKCHKVNNKCELVAAIAYLKEYFKENEVEFSMHGIKDYCMYGNKIAFPYLVKGSQYTFAGQDQQYDCENVSLEEFAKYLVESTTNKNKYDIGNGLTAEFKNCIIRIGCREYDKGYLIEKCEHILGINIDKLVIEGYSFSNVQIENLHNWLIKL